jgi:predicted TIM-barrel fold metal-dependent hydrolase
MIIDVNTSVGRWPFQAFDTDSPKALAGHLKSAGVAKAFVTSIESILFPDPAVYDAKLFRAAGPVPMLTPVPTLNPTLSNWREALARRGLKAVSIIPNYHQYGLDDERVAELMEALKAKRLPLMIRMRVEDERNQHPLMKVPGVGVDGIIGLAKRFPEVPIVCLCAYLHEATELAHKTDNVHFDISFIESFDTLATLLRKAPVERVLFGSHTPFLYTGAVLMKLTRARISKRAADAISRGNAERVFGL